MEKIVVKQRSGADTDVCAPIRMSSLTDEKNDPFARQKLVSWWDQDKIAKARVLVMGAGAIGNELLHNIALLGFRRVYICDMDEIELSNLSRTVLFTRDDEGRKKAEVAAERMREMCLADDARIDWFAGDVMFELGTGIFRHFDIVLGCLDNDATRFYIDKCCTMFGKPWLNAGISELAAGLQLINLRESGICFHCGAPADKVRQIMSRKASCGKTAIEDLKSGKIPTVQVASAIAAALQAQECVKFVCDKPVEWGKNFYFQGINNSFTSAFPMKDSRCMHHGMPRIEEVTELYSIHSGSTMRELLLEVGSALGLRGEYSIDMRAEAGREFVKSTLCTYCGEEIRIGLPAFRFKDKMAICPTCAASKVRVAPSEPIVSTVLEYSPDSDEEILDMTLRELGIPPLHVLTVIDESFNEHYVEISGDLARIAPNNFGKESD